MENLTLVNSHRAKTVVMREHPEKGAWRWEWHAEQVPSSWFGTHWFNHAINEASGEVVKVNDTIKEFNEWGVTEWKYDLNFGDLYQLGCRAFEGTSHVSVQRSVQYIRDFEKTLHEDLADLPEEEHLNYYNTFRTWVMTLFQKHSCIVSPMIAGPAKFNTRKADRANNAYDNAWNDFNKWRLSYAKKVARKVEAAKSPEQRADEEWERLKADLSSGLATIAGIDDGKVRCYTRSLFVNSVVGKVERLACNGNVEMVSRATELVKEMNQGRRKPLISARHKFWGLVAVAEKVHAKEQENAERESVEIEFPDCKVIVNFGLDRLQMEFDGKPPYDRIQALKKHGFRWSPTNGVWQRQLTENAYWSAASLLSPDGTFESREAILRQIKDAVKSAPTPAEAV